MNAILQVTSEATAHWPYCGITVWCYPHPSKVVCIDFVFDELPTALFVHVDATGLTVVDLTTNHSWIGVCFHLKAGNTVPMDITALKVTLELDKENLTACLGTSLH